MASALAAAITSLGSYAAHAHVQHPSKLAVNPLTQTRGANAAPRRGTPEARRELRHRLLASPTSTRKSAKVMESSTSGVASTYNDRHTASGETMDAGQMTAAHRTLPFGTKVTVVNHSNGRKVVVRINDRGPFVHGRVIDLSPAAARALGVHRLASVSLIVGSRENDDREQDDNAKTAASASDSATPERVADDTARAKSTADAVAP